MSRLLELYYDIACPFSYMATYAIRPLLRNKDVRVVWKPISIGSLQGHTSVDEGIKNAAKLAWMKRDLQMTAKRLKLPVQIKPRHRLLEHSFKAQRLLASIDDNDDRRQLSEKLYTAYWENNLDIQDPKILEVAAKETGLSVNVEEGIDKGERLLQAFNDEASNKGVYRLPSFYVSGNLYRGVDRLHLLERALGNTSAEELRLATPESANASQSAKLSFYFDFSSYWSYVANARLQKFVSDLHPIEVEIEYFPVAIGAIFKALGNPHVPIHAMKPAIVKATHADIRDHMEYLGNTLYKFNSNFPMRTLTSMRAILVNKSPELRTRFSLSFKVIIVELLITCWVKAAWEEDRNIADDKVVAEVIEESGLNSEEILAKVKDDKIKNQLKQNTSRALEVGAFGVPTFQLNDGPIIFGQDRLNVVADMICGWKAA